MHKTGSGIECSSYQSSTAYGAQIGPKFPMERLHYGFFWKARIWLKWKAVPSCSENTSWLIRLQRAAVVREGCFFGAVAARRVKCKWNALRFQSCGKKRKQIGAEIPGSVDLRRCRASGNFISILARVRGSVAEESYFDTHNGSELFPAAGLPGPRIINQPLME